MEEGWRGGGGLEKRRRVGDEEEGYRRGGGLERRFVDEKEEGWKEAGEE